MTTYISAVNQWIAQEVARAPNLVMFGENIDKGSCISGLTRKLPTPPGGRIINIGNCEYSHCGMGFGMMIGGASSVLFVKQLDFMLLAIDHFSSTYNFIRARSSGDQLGSFTIVTIVCDQGLQGPQSSFNALGSICSLARVPGYCITNDQDAPQVFRTSLVKPGFRFIGLSQRLFGRELLQLSTVWAAEDCSTFQYAQGNDATIVCFNFSLPEGNRLQRELLKIGLSADLFSANYGSPSNWDRIKQSAARTRTLVVIDDSKSVDLPCHRLMQEVADACPGCEKLAITRESRPEFGVGPDALEIDFEEVVSWMARASHGGGRFESRVEAVI